MSEFKYACPVCGQHIKCDSSHSGSVMECPTCFQKITVPPAPATDDPKFILTGTTAGKRRFPAAPVTPGPAAPPAKGSLVAGTTFVFLLCAAVAALFVFRGMIFESAPAGTNAVNTANPLGAPSNPAPGNPTAAALGYRVDAGEVVFVFEPAAFGVDIAADAPVHVAGNFNRWLDASDGTIHPAPAWQMQRVADHRYELHKQLADFHQRPQWEFKFVVNLNQWIEIPETALNRTAGQPVNLTLTIPDKAGGVPN